MDSLAFTRPKVLRKLVIQTPSSELVDAYLTEIANGYGIGWTSSDADTGLKDAAKVWFWILSEFSRVLYKLCH